MVMTATQIAKKMKVNHLKLQSMVKKDCAITAKDTHVVTASHSNQPGFASLLSKCLHCQVQAKCSDREKERENAPKLNSRLAQLATARPADRVSRGLISVGYSCSAVGGVSG